MAEKPGPREAPESPDAPERSELREPTGRPEAPEPGPPVPPLEAQTVMVPMRSLVLDPRELLIGTPGRPGSGAGGRAPDGSDGPLAAQGPLDPLLRDACDRLLMGARPVLRYALHPVTDRPRGGIEVGGLLLRGPRLGSALQEAELVAAFVLTLGSEIDGLLEGGEGSGITEGFLLDRGASILAEQMAEELHQRIRVRAERDGYGVTERYSPGYCDWPLSGQIPLDRLADFGAAGVRLTPEHHMRPIKSVSGVIGLGGAPTVADHLPCRECTRSDCGYRRSPYVGW